MAHYFYSQKYATVPVHKISAAMIAAVGTEANVFVDQEKTKQSTIIITAYVLK